MKISRTRTKTFLNLFNKIFNTYNSHSIQEKNLPLFRSHNPGEPLHFIPSHHKPTWDSFSNKMQHKPASIYNKVPTQKSFLFSPHHESNNTHQNRKQKIPERFRTEVSYPIEEARNHHCQVTSGELQSVTWRVFGERRKEIKYGKTL